MTEIESTPPKGTAINRRRVVVGAAWAVPVVATALAAPAAAASMVNPSLAFSNSNTGLLTLQLLDGGGTITAGVLTTLPSELTLTNGANASIDNETANVTVTVGRPAAGVNLPVGRARGFGVASFNGVPSTAGQRTVEYQTTALGARYGFPITTYTATHVFSAPQGGSSVLPVEFGLAGTNSGISVSLLASFPVSVTMSFANGVTGTASTTISLPVGAGLL